MKISFFKQEHGSVLIIAMMTITIMTMICATSLYIASQNSGSGVQTSGWQQALTASESGIDAGIRALNATASGSPAPWTNWKTVAYSTPTSNYTLPSVEPTATATPSATAVPNSSHYNYLPSSALTVSFPNSEGATSVSAWTTIDTVGATNLLSGSQWYRIRSTGQTIYPANSTILSRVSNNRLDNDLRNTIAMHFNRKGGSYAGPTRTIEVIMQPVVTSIWGQGILLKNALQMSGGGIIDHFNSSTAPSGQYSAAYRSSNNAEMVVGMLNANGSDLKSTFVYGSVSYSTTGAVPQNTTNVKGGLSSPFGGAVPTVSDPSWTSGSYTPYTASNNLPVSTLTTGTQNNPKLVKITGNVTMLNGNILTISSANSGANNNYITIWITGSLQVMAGASITQDSTSHVTIVVDGNITTAAGGFTNNAGYAADLSLVGVGSGNTVTVSGSGSMIATVEAPGDNFFVTGAGNLIGAVIGNTMTISGGASFHYDDALAGSGGSGQSAVGNYAFASWFEDNSDPSRNALDINGTTHPIVY